VAVSTLGILTVFSYRFLNTLTSSWNPDVALLPFALFIVSLAAVAAGKLRLFPFVCFAASFTVQAHLAFAVPVLIALFVALLFYGRRIDFRRRGPELSTALKYSLVVLAVLWVLPGLDQWSATGQNNMSQIARFFSSSSASEHGLTESASIFEHEFTAVLQPPYRTTETWVHGVQ